MDSHLYVHTLLVLELDQALHVWPHQYRVEGKDHLPQPAGKCPPPAQDTTTLLFCKGTLLLFSMVSTRVPKYFP